ncbi:Hsp20/alpha crystallin family protein [Geomesophilobacter sediminis]|nr:Hsp20/alpha crystallin family protein [Geomesophilobacter sediminis]
MANGITAQNEERSLQTGEETRAPEKFLRPAVNIIEDESELLLTADLPGALKDNIEIHVDQGILTINAPVSVQTTGRPLYREFEWAPYYRQFQIPEVIDQGQMKAEFRNGLLTLHLPKREAAKPRRVEISVAS